MSNYRYMRSILMFDLPTLTGKQRRDYRQFVKLIKKIGFIMFQESIYVKLSVNEANVKSSLEIIKKAVPKDGMISMMTVTEKQFSSMEMILGEFQTDTINTDERLIEL